MPLDRLESKPWHGLSVQDALALLDSDPERGLEPAEAARRLELHGPNQLPASKGAGPLRRILTQINQPLVWLLLAAGAVAAVLGQGVDAAVILGVVAVNAAIGFVQEAKALEAMAALAGSMVAQTVALRGGAQETLAAGELVPGDIVLLRAGDKSPADLRLVSGRELRLDESALTGESVPVDKSAEAVAASTVLAERANMIYSSTLATHGQGRGVVVATGTATEIGRISRLMSEVQELQTPLTRKMARFSQLVLWAVLGLAAATFGVGLWRGQPAAETFMAAVALAVGAIPEGLPAALTITLALGVSRMARRKAIIRRLPAVETLGSTTVICTDKTGTLTQNQMTVVEIAAGGRVYHLSGAGYDPAGEILENGLAVEAGSRPALREVLLAGALCNDGQLRRDEGGWRAQGDPTEVALLTAAAKAGLSWKDERRRRSRLDAIPFQSENQFMATMHDQGPGEPRAVYLKGAVEKVLARCTRAVDHQGGPAELDAAATLARAEEMARRGLRVLALARGELAPDDPSLEYGEVECCFTLLGLAGMIDPPRPEAVAAVAACLAAGVRVKMITGDHALTAGAVAERLGLAPEADAPALTGQEVGAMAGAELEEAAQATAVFARMTPEEKLRLVRALQARGEIVAMTGDGVNDAPALRQADIGVAMGQGGTEVAKEAADMVLADDNFATIAAAVEEGRGVFDNLVKFIVWTLPTNLGEGLVILAAVLAGATLPILPVQILWINMTTAVLLGLTLAFEPKEPGIMSRPPRDPGQPILTGVLIQRLVLVGALLLAGAFGLFQWELGQSGGLEQARTLAVNVFVLVETAYLFNCRSLMLSPRALGLASNPWLFLGAGLMLGLQILFTYWGPMNWMFHSAPISGLAWLGAVAAALACYLVVELEKLLRRRALRRPRRVG
jgi:Ca2+-transporting ATPase